MSCVCVHLSVGLSTNTCTHRLTQPVYTKCVHALVNVRMVVMYIIHVYMRFIVHTCSSISLVLGQMETPYGLFGPYLRQECRRQGDPEAAAHL